ncbi:MAG TPA: N-acetylmuramoyl-L-alanine amidase [Candidatus Borkfalkia faecigallinarum]|uniref:N-acetylmuramoyl-L-alanine amidase n=1 Tax=Candidatus Borkfalkia faecigallinarum TaxID=2838509 RepID=A0A9D1VUZ1_9FIRM|nr:N-acetylmuramoyl-L-alanine amidase [Candidatus Borkfalkia faecigallinarum]
MFVCRRGTLFALALSLVLLLSCSFVLSAASAAAVPANAPCIVLDAGHGGVDPGVVGRTTGEKESDVNLKIVQKLQKLFSDAGFRVVLTRKNAGGLYGLPTKGYKRRDMEERRRIIREAEPDFVLSVHQNTFPADTSRRGGQVFFREGSAAGEALAVSIQARLNALGGRSVSALKGDFFLLGCADCPSALVECGFLSNAEEERLLLTDEYQGKIARAVFEGVLSFLS